MHCFWQDSNLCLTNPSKWTASNNLALRKLYIMLLAGLQPERGDPNGFVVLKLTENLHLSIEFLFETGASH